MNRTKGGITRWCWMGRIGLALTVGWVGLAGQIALGFSGNGFGTPEEPYEITSVAQLGEVNDDLTAHYRLMNDLDLEWEYREKAVIAPFHEESSPQFTGSFDGNGKVIRNLSIEGDWGESGKGLFGRIGEGGQVLDLALEGAMVAGNSEIGILAGSSQGTILRCTAGGWVMGLMNVGGLVGFNTGEIAFSHTTGAVDVLPDSGWSFASGGLVGRNDGTIIECYATATVFGYERVGGLVGDNAEGATIEDSYARGPVTGDAMYAGGLAGYNYGAIRRSYSTGEVSGGDDTGGLVGGADEEGGGYADEDNFWDMNTSFQPTSAMGFPKTTTEMQTQSTFTNWDFVEVWVLDAAINDGYPHLRGNLPVSVARPEFTPDGGVFDSTFAVDVTLNCATPGAWIHYTLDGSEPTEHDPAQWDGGMVNVTLPATLKARAFAPEMDPSPIHEAFFDGRTASGVWFSWLEENDYAIDGSNDFDIPPGKTQDVRTHFFADLDPSNPDSFFYIRQMGREMPPTIFFDPSSAERVYTLEYTDDLLEPDWQPVVGQVRLPGGETDHMVDEENEASTRFYRVSVDLPSGPSDPDTYLDIRIELDDPGAGPPLQLDGTVDGDEVHCIASIDGGFGPTASFAWYVNGVRMIGYDGEEELFLDLLPGDRVAVVVSDGDWGWSDQWTVTDPGPSMEPLQWASPFGGGSAEMVPLTIWPPDWADAFGAFEVVVHTEGTQDAFRTRTVSEPGIVRFEDIPAGRYDVEIQALCGDPLSCVEHALIGHGTRMDVQVVEGAGTEDVVHVQPVMDATGDAHVLLEWAPESDVDFIEVFRRHLHGEWTPEPEFTLSGEDLSLGQYLLDFTDLSTGSHVIGIYLYRQDFLVSSAIEVVNVYGNYRTVGHIVIFPDDIFEPEPSHPVLPLSFSFPPGSENTRLGSDGITQFSREPGFADHYTVADDDAVSTASWHAVSPLTSSIIEDALHHGRRVSGEKMFKY